MVYSPTSRKKSLSKRSQVGHLLLKIFSGFCISEDNPKFTPQPPKPSINLPDLSLWFFRTPLCLYLADQRFVLSILLQGSLSVDPSFPAPSTCLLTPLLPAVLCPDAQLHLPRANLSWPIPPSLSLTCLILLLALSPPHRFYIDFSFFSFEI